MRHGLTAAITLIALAAATPFTAHSVPPIERWQTDNGATVLYVQTEALPIVDVQLTFDAGSARDGDQPGLARLTSNLLLEGTAERSAGEIARAFERRGARVSTSSARDMGTINLRSLAREAVLGEVVNQLAGVIAEPAFPEHAVARVKQQMLVGLRQDQQSARALASKAFASAVYGDHPYASPPEGTPDSVLALDRAAVQAFHERYYVARNATVAIVGDVSPERARSLADTLTADLPAGKAAPSLPDVPPLAGAKTVRVPFDGEQTHVIMGQPAVSRSAPDYFPLYVANHILGGNGLVSILSREMRDERGLSYSTYSYLQPMAQAGHFAIGTQVRSGALDEALAVLRETLRTYHENGPSADRLAAAQRHITGSFPLQYDSNSDLVGYIAMIGFYGLPVDYLERLPDRVRAVTEESATRAFREHIDPDGLVTVLVGPASAIGAD